MTWQPLTPEVFGLGESPFWHPQEQTLYWLDIAANTVLRANVRANVCVGTTERWLLPQTPGCMAPAASGGLVIALRDGIYRARTWGGQLKLIAPALHDSNTTRFNDGKADAQGRFWAGTIYEPRTRAAAGLFCLDGTGLHRKAGNATVANGLAFSPDARTLYWADTTAHVVRAWDWDDTKNELSDERVLRQFSPKPPDWLPSLPGYGGRPDGAAIDSQGNYWCALYEGARLLKLSPTGDVLADIPVPAQCPTMPCFGGDDLQTLYLTTASEKRPTAELAAQPLAGCVLSRQVEVPGLPVNFFRDSGWGFSTVPS